MKKNKIYLLLFFIIIACFITVFLIVRTPSKHETQDHSLLNQNSYVEIPKCILDLEGLLDISELPKSELSKQSPYFYPLFAFSSLTKSEKKDFMTRFLQKNKIFESAIEKLQTNSKETKSIDVKNISKIDLILLQVFSFLEDKRVLAIWNGDLPLAQKTIIQELAFVELVDKLPILQLQGRARPRLSFFASKEYLVIPDNIHFTKDDSLNFKIKLLEIKKAMSQNFKNMLRTELQYWNNDMLNCKEGKPNFNWLNSTTRKYFMGSGLLKYSPQKESELFSKYVNDLLDKMPEFSDISNSEMTLAEMLKKIQKDDSTSSKYFKIILLNYESNIEISKRIENF